MDNELQLLHQSLINVKNPEDIFGSTNGASNSDDKISTLKRVFVKLAIKAHPDHFMQQDDKVLANETFKILNIFWEQAQNKIKQGTYGDNKTPMDVNSINSTHITSKKYDYTLGKLISIGTISDLYSSNLTKDNINTPTLIKITRESRNNDLLTNEASILKYLRENSQNDKLVDLIPECIDSFTVPSTNKILRQANVFSYNNRLISLAEVISAYPNGIDPKDMAWMFKRILATLWFAHSKNIIHGAVLPTHVLLNLENHGILLVDWTVSVKDNSHYIKAIDQNYLDYYPKSVFDKQIPKSDTDIYMAAMIMIKLLGGDVKNKQVPDIIPKPIRLIIRACILGMDDAMVVHQEFDKVIRELFGQPKFRDFKLPTKN
jgi:phage terminase large subunit-like protein